MPNIQDNWVPNLTGRATPEVAYAIQRIYTELNAMKVAGINAGTGTRPAAFQAVSGTDVNKLVTAIQANGSNPLKVTGLSGQLSEPQKGKATRVTTLPQFNDPLSQDGSLIVFNNVVYRYDMSTNPGQWEPIQGVGVLLVGTHSDRLATPATGYAAGTGYVETDRMVLYRSDGTNWIYVTGQMKAVIASRPSDLGTNDAGFLFLATDTLNSYYWTGSAWVLWTTASGGTVTSVNGKTGAVIITIADTSSNMSTYTPASYPTDAIYMQTDRKVMYRNTGSAWVYFTGTYDNTLANIPVGLGTNDTGYLFYVTDLEQLYQWSGSAWAIQAALGVIIVDTHAARSGYSPTSYPVGCLYEESDRQALYRNSGTAWLLVGAFHAGNTASKPGDLGANDFSFLYYETTTSSLQYWTGSAWAAIGGGGGSGTVTSVAMTVPSSLLTVSGTPITTSGTLAISLANQSANQVFCGPSSGSPAAPTFRALVPADISLPAWDHTWVPTITSSGTMTNTTLETGWQQLGKLVYFRLYWQGHISGSTSQFINFSVPVARFSQTGYQCAATHYHNGSSFNASGAIINGSNISIESTAVFPITTTLTIAIEGVYEAA